MKCVYDCDEKDEVVVVMVALLIYAEQIFVQRCCDDAQVELVEMGTLVEECVMRVVDDDEVIDLDLMVSVTVTMVVTAYITESDDPDVRPIYQGQCVGFDDEVVEMAVHLIDDELEQIECCDDEGEIDSIIDEMVQQLLDMQKMEVIE